MNEPKILTYTTKDGVKYEYRVADGVNIAPMGSWVGETNYRGEPTNVNDQEFDAMIDLYMTEREFYTMSDEELINEICKY